LGGKFSTDLPYKQKDIAISEKFVHFVISHPTKTAKKQPPEGKENDKMQKKYCLSIAR